MGEQLEPQSEPLDSAQVLKKAEEELKGPKPGEKTFPVLKAREKLQYLGIATREAAEIATLDFFRDKYLGSEGENGELASQIDYWFRRFQSKYNYYSGISENFEQDYSKFAFKREFDEFLHDFIYETTRLYNRLPNAEKKPYIQSSATDEK